MSILVDATTKVICQGITGKAGAFHTRLCREYGTDVVAGVTPGKGGQMFDGVVPIYNTIAEAAQNHHADASMIFVPPLSAAQSIIEAAEAGIKVIVCITEGIPQKDMMFARVAALRREAVLIGPNCPGIITPDHCKIGIMPGNIHRPGAIGVISRSGTLTYEAVSQLSEHGLGQSTCVGIGGDPIHGIGFCELIKLFSEDPDTAGIVLIGEIGGTDEEKAAAWISKNGTKPVLAFIAGISAPPGRRMGHAGAIINGSQGTADNKILALSEAGVSICQDPTDIGENMSRLMRERSAR
jgi:succinyl-CoA synthetase alpha subunit